MKKFVFSMLLISLCSFENDFRVEAQEAKGKMDKRPESKGKRPPKGWTPPDDLPPPPPGWKPGDPIPKPKDGQNQDKSGKKDKRGKNGNSPQVKG